MTSNTVRSKQRASLRLSKKQEKSLALRVGGRRRPGSGNKWFAKHDVGAKHVLVEAKITESESYALKRNYVSDFIASARGEGKVPMLVVEFSGREPLELLIFDSKDVELNGEFAKVVFKDE